MRVVITGGTGMIGQALTATLANDGHEVIVVSRSPRQSGPVPQNVTFTQWDAKTAEGWGEFVNGADAVVNLAATNLAGEHFFPSRWTPERRQLILESRLNTGRACVEAIDAAANKPAVLIQPSAVGYYGPQPFSVEITEDSPPADDFLANVCKQWEACTEAVEAMGVRRVITRSGAVLSNEGGALTRQILPFKLFVGGPIGGPLGSGPQPYPWIHIDDEAGAIRFLIENANLTGVFNLTGPEMVTNADFAKVAGKVLKRPSFFPVPDFVMHLLFGDVASVITTGQRVVPKRLLDSGYRFKFETLEAAIRDLYGG